jgi:hypothetical protein
MNWKTNATRADATGLAAVALASGAASAALYSMRAIHHPWIIWMIATPCLVAASLWLWHGDKKTQTWDQEEWSALAIFTPLFGAMSFGIDVMVGSSNRTYRTFLEAASHAGSPFGFPLTVLICPIGTILALGGWARCAIIRRLTPEP